MTDTRYMNVIGTTRGSRWRKPAKLRRAAVVARINCDVSMVTAYADGDWFYCATMPASHVAFFKHVTGLNDAPPKPLAATGDDRNAPREPIP